MSGLNQLLNTVTKKQPLWEKLSSHLPEIEREKESGKTYKEIAELFGVDDPARFSRALKKAKEEAEAKTNTDKNDEEISFSPTLPALNKANIEEVTIDDDEVENTEVNNEPSAPSTNVQTQTIDDEAIKKIEELLINIQNLKTEVIDVASEEAASAISAEIVNLNLSVENAKKETEKYSNDAKKYVSKVTSQAITTVAKKAADTVVNRLEEANQEINKRKSRYKPDKWVAMAVISCLIIGGASYYAGIINNKYMSDYRVAKSNEAKWAKFVEKWQIATEEEKKAVDSMMSRVGGK